MNRWMIMFPLLGLLVSGCVSKSNVQAMIDLNNEDVVNPRLEAHEERVKLLEDQQMESRRLTETQRQVLIRHFELLQELSEDALNQLTQEDAQP